MLLPSVDAQLERQRHAIYLPWNETTVSTRHVVRGLEAAQMALLAGFLPCASSIANRGAADLLEAQLFAYGVGSSIAVAEVHGLQLACLLQGGHRNHAVTAVKWCPDCHSRDLKNHSHLRLASGDSDGGVAVWSVLDGTVVSRLEDHSASSSKAGAGGPGSGPGGVAGLAWVMSSPTMLAVLVSPGTLLLWDAKGGAVLWRRELSPSPSPDVWQRLEVDPLDCRRLAVTSAQGGLALVGLTYPAAERVDVRQYRVNIGAPSTSPASAAATASPPATFSALFCATRDLLFLLLPREIIVYDSELGTPAATRPLPPGRPPFSALLGVYGRGVSAGGGDEGGCDVVHVVHVDGSLSVFVRAQGELHYTLSCSARLTPPPQRGTVPPVTLVAVCAGVMRQQLGAEEAAQARQSQSRMEAATQRLRSVFMPSHIGDSGGGGSNGTAGSASSGGANTVRSGATHGGTADPPHKPEHLPSTAAASSSGGSHQHHHGQQHHHNHHHHPHHHPAPPGLIGPGQAALVPSGAAAASGGAGPGGCAEPRPLLLILALTGDGRLWRWDSPLPLPPLPHSHPSGAASRPLGALPPQPHASPLPTHHHAGSSTQPSHHQHQHHHGPGAAAFPPKLMGLLHTLPSAVTSFALYPRPVAATALGLAGVGSGGCGVGGGGVVVLGAAATAGGSVELFTVQRGLVLPLSLHVSSSLAVHKDPIRGVRWLGSSPRLATFSSDRGQHGWRNTLLLTDVRSGRSSVLRDRSGEANPLLGVRASPCGCYLLVLIKGAPAELWGVWPGAAPTRLRLLDLPFTSLEWVQPQLPYAQYGSTVQAHVVTSWQVGQEPPVVAVGAGGSVRGGAAGSGGGGGHRASGDGGGGMTGQQNWSESLPPPSVSTSYLLNRPPSYHPSSDGGGPGGGPPIATSPPAQRTFGSSVASPPQSTGPAGAPDQPGGTPPLTPHSADPNPDGTPTPPRSPLPYGTATFATATGQSSLPAEAYLAFALAEGRVGVLSIHGKNIRDMKAKRPNAGLLTPLDMASTAMAAWGSTVVMGDAEGRLAVWEYTTGRTTVVVTGLGLVRKIYAGPPVPPIRPPACQPRGPSSSPAPPVPATGGQQGSFPRASAPSAPGPSSGSPMAGGLSSALQGRPMAPAVHPMPYAPYNKARVAVLFASGQCCVFDLDSTLKLRATPASATAVQRAGFRAVLDAAWLPLGWPEGDGGSTAGGGGVSLLTVVSDEGTVSVLDVAGVSTGSAAQQLPQQQGGAGPAGAPAGAAATAASEVGKPPRPSSGTIPGATTAAAGQTGAAVGSAAAAGATGTVSGPGAGSLPHGSRRYALGGVSARTLALRTALAPSPHPPALKIHDAAGSDLLGGEVRDAASAARFQAGVLGVPAAPGDKQVQQQQEQESPAAGLEGADGSSSPSGVRVCLEQAPSMGSCLLLPRPWAMLLRLLLQLGLSQEALRYLCGPHTPGEAEEEDLRHELLALVPRAAHGPLLALLADQGATDDGQATEALGAQSLASHGATSAANGTSSLLEPSPSFVAGSPTGRDNAGSAAATLSPATGTSPASAPVEPPRRTSGGGAAAASTFGLPSSMLRAVSLAINTISAGVTGGSGGAAGSSTGGRRSMEGAAAAAAAAAGGGGEGQGGGDGGGGGGGGGGSSSQLYKCNVLQLLHMLASMRAQGRLLHPSEWLRYSAATAPGRSPAERMAVAAAAAGDAAEARFWSHLPATLAAVQDIRESITARRLAEAAQQGAMARVAAAAANPASAGGATTSAGGGPPAGAAGRISGTFSRTQLNEPPPALRSVQSFKAPGAPGGQGGAAGGSGAAGQGPEPSGGSGTAAGAAGQGLRRERLPLPYVTLWDEHLALAEAQERLKWHEALSRSVFDSSPVLQERRLIEYVALGDLQTAVAFLLASSPDTSARYYRDALCTMALAAAAAAAAAAAGATTASSGGAGAGVSGGGALPYLGSPGGPRASSGGGPVSRGPGSMLLVQAAKVVSAHAASVGDQLLGVPLHVAAGLPAEAVLVLQENGMWRYAANLIAHSLIGTERAQALQRWAHHVWHAEGSVWRALGILTAAGCLGEALRVLLDAGLPDCAAAYVAACRHAGLTVTVSVAPATAGESCQQLPEAAGNLIQMDSGGDAWSMSDMGSPGPGGGHSRGGVRHELGGVSSSSVGSQGVVGGRGRGGGGPEQQGEAKQLGRVSGSGLQQGAWEEEEELFDALEQSQGAVVPGSGVGRGVGDLRRAGAEFERFVTDLFVHLL